MMTHLQTDFKGQVWNSMLAFELEFMKTTVNFKFMLQE